MFRLSGRDDLDTPIRIHWTALPRAWRAAGRGRTHPGRLRTTARLIETARVIGGVMMVAGTLAILALAVGLTIAEGPTGVWLLAFAPVASVLIFAGSSAVAWFGGFRSRLGEWMIGAQLAVNRCPACDYTLQVVPTMLESTSPTDFEAPVSICRCSECGCGWRADRLGGPERQKTEVIIIRASPPPGGPTGTH
jgi:hypothetical protein